MTSPRRLPWGPISTAGFQPTSGPIGKRWRREAAGQHLLAAQADVFAQIDRAELAWPARWRHGRTRRPWWQSPTGKHDIEQRSFSAGAGDRPALVATHVAATEARLLQLAAAYEAQSRFGELEDAYRRPLQGAEGEA